VSQYRMPEYEGMVKATYAWIAYCDGDTTLAQTEGAAALELWERHVVFPFRWTALWPLIAIALERDSTGDAIAYAKKMLVPTQQTLPAQLNNLVRTAIAEHDAGRSEEALGLIKRARGLARELAYL